MVFTQLLEKRRSIRKYDSSKKVTSEQINEVINAAIQAPSWKNSQTARYYAIVSPDRIEEFCSKCLPERIADKAIGAALIVCTFVSDVAGFSPEKVADNECGNGWGFYDMGLHNANLLLKAAELGLGTLVMGIRDGDSIREMLSIPDTETIGPVIAIGYPDVEPAKPVRKTVEEILTTI